MKRYIASRSIALALQGVPGVYAHGVIGTSNDYDLFNKTKHNRDINRGTIDLASLSEVENDSDSRIWLIRRYVSRLALARTTQRAFHPRGEQRVLFLSPDLFTVLRTSPEKDRYVLTITNVTAGPCDIEIPLSELGVDAVRWHDLLSEKEWTAEEGGLSLSLEPYDVIWLEPA